MMTTRLLAVVAVPVLLLAAACGGKDSDTGFVDDGSIPQATVEAQLTAGLSENFEDEFTDISCPGDVDDKDGATMTCSASLDGTAYDIPVTVTSEEKSSTLEFDYSNVG